MNAKRHNVSRKSPDQVRIAIIGQSPRFSLDIEPIPNPVPAPGIAAGLALQTISPSMRFSRGRLRHVFAHWCKPDIDNRPQTRAEPCFALRPASC